MKVGLYDFEMGLDSTLLEMLFDSNCTSHRVLGHRFGTGIHKDTLRTDLRHFS